MRQYIEPIAMYEYHVAEFYIAHIFKTATGMPELVMQLIITFCVAPGFLSFVLVIIS